MDEESSHSISKHFQDSSLPMRIITR